MLGIIEPVVGRRSWARALGKVPDETIRQKTPWEWAEGRKPFARFVVASYRTP
jgi:hypothetical protein